MIFKFAYLWFFKYKLRYLLRTSLLIFIALLLINVACFLLMDWSGWWNCHVYCEEPIFLGATFTSSLLVLAMVLIRYHWIMPLSIVQVHEAVGFDHLTNSAGRRRVLVRHLARKMSRHKEVEPNNPAFPNGWFPLVESDDVPAGQVVSVVALGQKWCVYRGETGRAYVLDAYCPHLGADLSAGGHVVGDCVECPFHGWRFDGSDNGRCTLIPYAEKPPEAARASKRDSCEKNGFIFVWYHAEGEPPTWELPTLPDIESGHWKFRGRTDHTVHCHIQIHSDGIVFAWQIAKLHTIHGQTEIPENGADIAHLPQVHSKSVFEGNTWLDSWRALYIGRLVRHQWQPSWQADEEQPHKARIHLSQRMSVCGYTMPFSELEINIEQIGPATVFLALESSFGRGMLLQNIVPEGPLCQRIIHRLYTEPKFRAAPAAFLVWSEAVMLERDIAIWNSKKFLKNPVLVREDKLIKKFRRWYAQFYSPNSPTLQDVRDKGLDW